MSYDSPPLSPTPQKKPRGCFFYGCLISAILLIVGILVVVGTVYFGYRYLINTAKEYTETTPATLPPVTMPEAQREILRKKFQTFGTELKAGTASEPIVLTADDVNALIDDNPDFKGKVHIVIDGDKIKGEISLPLRVLKIAELEDRYLNGSATLLPSLQNGVLDVRAESIETKGKPLPEAFIQVFRDKNLAEGAKDDPKVMSEVNKLSSIEVKNGTIILTPKVAAKPADAPVLVPPLVTPKEEAAKEEKPKDAPAADAPKEPKTF